MPPKIWRSLKTTVNADTMWKTRSIPPPSTMVVAAPAPLIVRSPTMSRSPVAPASSFVPGIVSV